MGITQNKYKGGVIMVTVVYRTRNFIDRFKCIETKQTLKAIKFFKWGNLYYFYKDRYNTVTIPADDIISIVEVKHYEGKN